MKPLVFTSSESFSGKSSMCVGIGKILKEKGYKVGYLKPVCMLPEKIGDYYVDEDVHYIIDILDLKDNPQDICPLIFTDESYDRALLERINASPINYIEKIIKALDIVSTDKDIVLIESARNLNYGAFAGISSKDICKAVKARAVLIMKYEDDIVDKILHFSGYFGNDFGGIIINMIPPENKERVEDLIVPFLEKMNLNLFGIIYSDSFLRSITINDMAKYLEGEILCARDQVNELVESFMVGAMGHEMALRFFKTKPGKVVITGGDRADIQFAALETDTKCLVLTGNFQPSSVVLSRADELGVPVVLVKYDTLTTVSKLNEIMGRSNLHEVKKLNKLVEIINNSLHIDKIIESVNI